MTDLKPFALFECFSFVGFYDTITEAMEAARAHYLEKHDLQVLSIFDLYWDIALSAPLIFSYPGNYLIQYTKDSIRKMYPTTDNPIVFERFE